MTVMELRHGNCLDVLAVAARAGERYHAVVTDPPYHLLSITKRFAKTGGADRTLPTKHHQFRRLSKGFMGKTWDGGDVAFRPETWRLVYDVLYPGAHMAVFGGTRTFHRMAVAIEDAGFEIRDTLFWLYGTGFPKSHDVSKGIDKVLGAERDKVRPRSVISHSRSIGNVRPYMSDPDHMTVSDDPATEEAAAWTGYGTALKPAHEPILLVRKPLEGTVARNVMAHGVGGLNIDGCRVPGVDAPEGRTRHGGGVPGAGTSYELPDSRGAMPAGRWPPNILHDGSPQVLEAFGRFGESKSPPVGSMGGGSGNRQSEYGLSDQRHSNGYGDSGSAARFFPTLGYTEEDYRFFYSSKANKAERMGSQHPTVKPIALLRWLARLITPPGGRILDPFAGTGTTGAAARAEGFGFTGIEMTDEYVEDCIRRLPEASVDRGPWGLDLRDTLARNRAAHDKLTEALRHAERL